MGPGGGQGSVWRCQLSTLVQTPSSVHTCTIVQPPHSFSLNIKRGFRVSQLLLFLSSMLGIAWWKVSMVELVWYVTLVWQGVSVECGFVKYADEMPRHSSCRSTSHDTSWNEDLAIAVALLNQTVNLVCHGHQSLTNFLLWNITNGTGLSCEQNNATLNSAIIILEEVAIWYS